MVKIEMLQAAVAAGRVEHDENHGFFILSKKLAEIVRDTENFSNFVLG